ncbi:MAG: hypothetical protein OSB63_01185 [Planctomycetota bacterium]|nr:hypothetical protein [Planctomycetota bacterium]
MNNNKYFLAAQLGAAIHHDDDEALTLAANQLRHSYSELALLDALRLSHLFCGIPKLIRSLNLLAPFNCELQTNEIGNGRQLFSDVYGNDAEIVLEHLNNTDSATRQWVINHAYGDVFANSSYSLLEREMTSILILSLGNCHQQALSHVRACKRHGATATQLLADANEFSFSDNGQRQRLVTSIRDTFIDNE